MAKSMSTKDVIADKYGLLIDGKFVDAASGKTFATTNPATGEHLGEVAEGGEEDIARAAIAARKAFEGPWRKMSGTERGRLLRKVADIIRLRQEELSFLDTFDCGKPISDTRCVDVPMSAEFFDYYGGWCDKITGSTYPVSETMHNYSRREPYGVVGLITAWNFPILNASIKIAPAIACGNTCILKASELTPLSAIELGKICLEAGIPEGVVNVVPGYGEIAGEALVKHPDVDKVAFTGSTAIGKHIMKTAAETMKAVTLECGGKSANIVYPDADIEAAVYYAAFGVFINSGQECVASSRLFLHKDIHDAFMKRLVEVTNNIRVGDPLDENTIQGSLVSKEQYDKTLRYIEIGKKTATLACGGEALTEPPFDKGFFIRPTVFDGVTNDMQIAREEIFGPVLSVLTWEDEEEVLRQANDTTYGLAGAVWTRDIANGHEIAKRIQAGTVWINATCQFHWCAPFGGTSVPASGERWARPPSRRSRRLRIFGSISPAHPTSGRRTVGRDRRSEHGSYPVLSGQAGPQAGNTCRDAIAEACHHQRVYSPRGGPGGLLHARGEVGDCAQA